MTPHTQRLTISPHPFVVACPANTANCQFRLIYLPRPESDSESFGLDFGGSVCPELVRDPPRPCVLERVGVARAEEASSHHLTCNGPSNAPAKLQALSEKEASRQLQPVVSTTVS